MKSTTYTSSGEKKGTIELPNVFSSPIREDLVMKYFEVSKTKQPYSPKIGAGIRQQGYNQISHKRHDWKGHYGKGISRVPRKTMSRRGTNFYWIASNMPSARGGRRAFPPTGIYVHKKINKKEINLAINSGIAATSNIPLIQKRYENLHSLDHAPFIIDSLPQKTKSLVHTLKKILEKNINLGLKHKEIRAGKGKKRGRKYKSNAGILILTGKEEKANFKGFDIKNIKNVEISDLYPLGRLALYTEKAIRELNIVNSGNWNESLSRIPVMDNSPKTIPIERIIHQENKK